MVLVIAIIKCSKENYLDFMTKLFMDNIVRFHYSLLKNFQILSGIAYIALLTEKKCVYHENTKICPLVTRQKTDFKQYSFWIQFIYSRNSSQKTLS